MKQGAFKLALAFVVGFAPLLLPGAAWAWGNRGVHHGVHLKARSGHHVFKGHGAHRVFKPHGVKFKRHGHFRHPRVHRHFRHNRLGHFKAGSFGAHHFKSHAIVVHPRPTAVWIPASWRWNGYRWIWVPGFWAWR